MDKVLAPYVGFRRTRRSEFWRRAVTPILVGFCLIYGLAWGFYGPFFPTPFAIAPAVLGMLAIWALPEMKTAPTRPVEILLFTCMLALILWPNYLAIALPGLPWITMFRLFAAPLTIIFLVCISVSQAFRSELLRIINVAPLIWKLLVIFVAVQVATIGVSTHPASSFQQVINSQFNWTLT
ncbi:MAG TPA: hypothetical protein VFN88_04170, partial [Caulobacteraceae bacterium]|nr:hypothetical protein [Caulobacteraceae bacterium]